MKKLTLTMVMMVTLSGCAGWQGVAKTVIDAVVATCVSAHPEVNDERMMREICKYAPDVAPIVLDMISQRNEGLKRAGLHVEGTSAK